MESWKSSDDWYGIIDENVLDTMYKNEERYKYIILDMLGIEFDDNWSDYIFHTIIDLADRKHTEGLASSVEELVDILLKANL